MKTILYQGPSAGSAEERLFETGANDMTQQWRELRRRLNDWGYKFTTADNNSLDNCAWILFNDSFSVDGFEEKPRDWRGFIKQMLNMKAKSRWPVRNLYQEAIKNGMKDRVALILWEGKAVNPNNYNQELFDRFKYIFTWDDDLVDNKKFFKYMMPTPIRPVITQSVPFSERKLLVNISAHRYSHYSHELYSARRKTSKYFDTHYPNDFDLFGARWHRPLTRLEQYFPSLVMKFSTWRGVSPNKLKTMSQYKFSLCYENISNVKGYISEKIFDTIQADSVPIYWGADNIEDYVDPKAFVDRRKFKSDKDLADFLFGVKEAEYNDMLVAGRNYIKSDQFKQFTPSVFCDRLMEVLDIKPADGEK